MVTPILPPDDLPPQHLELDDRVLRQQLDWLLIEQFQRQSDPALQQQLAPCAWSITTAMNVVTLVIVCPDRTTNWQVLQQVVGLGEAIAQFSQDAKLRIYSTPEMLDWFEIRVDELSIYRESA